MSSKLALPLSAILFTAILICQWHQLPENAELTPPILSASSGKVSQTGMSPKQGNREASSVQSSNQAAAGKNVNKGDSFNAKTNQHQTKKSKDNKEKKVQDNFTCKDADGREVAWFIAIKEKGSWRYTFATSRNTNFQTGTDIRNDGPVYQTLFQTRGFEQNTDTTYAYTSNNSREGREGHQNGVLLLGSQKGFWLIHSWRRLYSYFRGGNPFQDEKMGRTKGQSFICTTHKRREDYEKIIEQLEISRPKPETGFRRLAASNANANIAGFTLVGNPGHKVVHFSKWETEKNNIYSLIADKYGILEGGSYRLSVQSWGRAQTSEDDRVDLIAEHTYPGLAQMDQNADHSKWCVPVRNGGGGGNYLDNLKFVCIGDLNMHSRGGGAICACLTMRLHKLLEE